MVVEESKLIDKIFFSMTGNKRYFLIIQHFLTQRRNEELTPSYNFSKLTMTEVESHLYTEDENSTTTSRAYRVQAFHSKSENDKKTKEKFEKRQKYRWENKLCFFCGSPNHQKKDCSKWIAYKKRKENANSTKEIVLQGNDSKLNNSSMARLGNVGHSTKTENIDIPSTKQKEMCMT